MCLFISDSNCPKQVKGVSTNLLYPNALSSVLSWDLEIIQMFCGESKDSKSQPSRAPRSLCRWYRRLCRNRPGIRCRLYLRAQLISRQGELKRQKINSLPSKVKNPQRCGVAIILDDNYSHWGIFKLSSKNLELIIVSWSSSTPTLDWIFINLQFGARK